MERCGAEVDDLYAFCLPRLDRIQLPRDVLFTDEGYALLGERVAAAIRGALGRA